MNTRHDAGTNGAPTGSGQGPRAGTGGHLFTADELPPVPEEARRPPGEEEEDHLFAGVVEVPARRGAEIENSVTGEWADDD